MISTTSWIKNPATEKAEAKLEFRVRDFYGPFVLCQIERNGTTKVKPIELRVETPECSESDFSLMCKMSKEVFTEFGKFTLILKDFSVEITSVETAEEKIREKILGLRLF